MKKRTALILVAIISTVIAAAVIIGVSIYDFYERSFPYGEDAYNGISVRFKEDTPTSEEIAIVEKFDANIFADELHHTYTLSYPGKTIQYVEEQLQILLEYEQVDRLYTYTVGVVKRDYRMPDYGENGKVSEDN